MFPEHGIDGAAKLVGKDSKRFSLADKLSRVESIFADGKGLIVAEFELFEACEAVVIIACRINATEKLSNCMSLGGSKLNDLFRPFEYASFDEGYLDGNRLYDAPADSRTSTTLQLLLEEMSGPVTEE